MQFSHTPPPPPPPLPPCRVAGTVPIYGRPPLPQPLPLHGAKTAPCPQRDMLSTRPPGMGRCARAPSGQSVRPIPCYRSHRGIQDRVPPSRPAPLSLPQHAVSTAAPGGCPGLSGKGMCIEPDAGPLLSGRG